VLGISDDPLLLLQRDPNHYLLFTGGKDAHDTPGKLVVFRSPHVDALLTTNNGGPGGTDTGRPLHIARAVLENKVAVKGGYFNGVFYGANDSGNASADTTMRRQPSYLDALILQDVYGYT